MDITIRPLDHRDLPEAERIFRLAFGTFLGLPDPMAFMGDADLVRPRWRAAPAAALGAYLDQTLVGPNFAARWGSIAFFGPLTIRPDLWDCGIAQRLLTATTGLFEAWGIRQVALFTFPQCPKHLALYQKFGFWPQHLTPVMAKSVESPTTDQPWSTYSALPLDAREPCLTSCGTLTHAVYPGLNVRGEIQAVAEQHLGDTVLLQDSTGLAAFAICHLGPGSEAGSGAAYVKFGAIRPGVGATQTFTQLLTACEALAQARGLEQFIAGVNTARHGAYQLMLAHGFRTFLTGVAMQRPNAPGYNRADCFVIDDWR